jgi:hypothetical protein
VHHLQPPRTGLRRHAPRARGVAPVLLAFTLPLALAACGGGGDGTNGGQPVSAAPQTNAVSGTASYEGAPLAGATITVWNTNTNAVVATATTDAAGHYSVAGLVATANVAQDYQLWATKAGLAFYPSVGAGANVERFDYTGQYATSVSGMYKTVINYDSTVAGGSLAGADFSAFDGNPARVALAATGQLASYGAGDDGAWRAGVAAPAPRFTDNMDGTVSDALTGLTWLRDAGCLPASDWPTAVAAARALASGQCGLGDGSSAGQWRLPNINELDSLLDLSRSAPALPAAHPFLGTATSPIWWSSTTYFGLSTEAWAIRLADGRWMNDNTSNVKATSVNGAWAVRGAGHGAVGLAATGQYVQFAAGDDGALQAGMPLTYPRFIDHGDGTVTDTMTGFTWLKQADCINRDWAGALAAVAQLASGQCGLADGSHAGDWRMPNRRELESLADRALGNHADYYVHDFVTAAGTGSQPAIFSGLVAFQYYWTSSTVAADASSAWTVFSCDFGAYDTPKAGMGYTLALR